MSSEDVRSVPTRLLIIGAAGIGNLLMLLPTLQELRRRFSDAEITMLVTPNGSERLFADERLVDRVEVIPLYKWLTPSSHNVRVVNVLRLTKTVVASRARAYDISLWPCVITTTPRMEWLSFLLGARRRILHAGRYPQLNTLVAMPPRTHLVEHNLNLLSPLGIQAVPPERLNLPLTEGEIQRGLEFLRRFNVGADCKYVGFQPGGNVQFDAFRQWHPRNYAALGDRLVQSHDVRIILFGSPDERSMLETIAAEMHPTPIVVTDLDLRQVAAVLYHLDLFVANDSALMHLASAVDTCTLGILGPTDPLMTGPWGVNAHVIRLNLSCSPCYVASFQRRCKHHACLTLLSVEEVFRVASRLLERDRELLPRRFECEDAFASRLSLQSVCDMDQELAASIGA